MKKKTSKVLQCLSCSPVTDVGEVWSSVERPEVPGVTLGRRARRAILRPRSGSRPLHPATSVRVLILNVRLWRKLPLLVLGPCVLDVSSPRARSQLTPCISSSGPRVSRPCSSRPVLSRGPSCLSPCASHMRPGSPHLLVRMSLPPLPWRPSGPISCTFCSLLPSFTASLFKPTKLPSTKQKRKLWPSWDWPASVMWWLPWESRRCQIL